MGNTEIAETLLEYGADVNVRGLHHCTGLVWAAGKSNVSLVRLLLDHGAKVDTGDKYGTTPLIWVQETKFHSDLNSNSFAGLQKGKS